MDYTITLTETQNKCMEFITPDIDDWITTAATHRADLAMYDIIALNTAHCNKNGIAIKTINKMSKIFFIVFDLVILYKIVILFYIKLK